MQYRETLWLWLLSVSFKFNIPKIPTFMNFFINGPMHNLWLKSKFVIENAKRLVSLITLNVKTQIYFYRMKLWKKRMEQMNIIKTDKPINKRMITNICQAPIKWSVFFEYYIHQLQSNFNLSIPTNFHTGSHLCYYFRCIISVPLR